MAKRGDIEGKAMRDDALAVSESESGGERCRARQWRRRTPSWYSKIGGEACNFLGVLNEGLDVHGAAALRADKRVKLKDLCKTARPSWVWASGWF